MNIGARFNRPSISAKGNRMVATLERYQREIWQAPLGPDPKANAARAKRLLDASWNPWWTQVPRGAPVILLNSPATGSRNLWLMPIDASSSPRQLTSLPGNVITHAALSPDGRRLAYSSVESGNAEVWVMNLDGSNPVRLTDDPGQDFWPTWSPDGKWVAFHSNRSAGRGLWKAPSDGGPAERVSNVPFSRTDWSPVDNRIAISAGSQSANPDRVKVVDADSGKILWEVPSPESFPVWSPDGKSLSVVQGDGGNVIRILDGRTGEGRVAVEFPDNFHMIFRAAWTPDGKSLIVNRQELLSHIVLIENF